MKVVTFNRMFPPYRAGDVAGLRDDIADRAINGGYAVKGEVKPEPKKPEKRDEPART